MLSTERCRRRAGRRGQRARSRTSSGPMSSGMGRTPREVPFGCGPPTFSEWTMRGHHIEWTAGACSAHRAPASDDPLPAGTLRPSRTRSSPGLAEFCSPTITWTQQHYLIRYAIGQDRPFPNDRSPSDHHGPNNWEIPPVCGNKLGREPVFTQVAAYQFRMLNQYSQASTSDP
jgi:hypothetical protein